MDLEPQLRDFLTSFQRLAEVAGRTSADDGPTLTDALRTHLGVSPDRVAVVSKEVVAHRFADYDVTFERMAGPDAEVLGIGGGDQRHHMSLADLVSNAWHRPLVGQVDWTNVPINATDTRRAMALGIRLFTYRDQPVAVLQRRRSRMHGNGVGVFEVLCPDARRAVLYAAEAGAEPRDEHLRAAFEALQADRAALERRTDPRFHDLTS